MDDMVRRYKKDDYETICMWLQERGLSFPERDLLPKLGYVFEGVGCGFMYVADKKLGIFEFFITNRHANEGLRERGLDLITATLIEDARNMKLKVVMAQTKLSRMQKHIEYFQGTYTGQLHNYVRYL